jgi:TRAP-type C4-dicarboxylate transport system permease small subunit
VIYQAIKPKARRWIAIFNTATLAVLFLAALPGTLEYIWFLRRRSSMMLQIPMHLVYLCFPVFMIAVVVGAVLRLRRLSGASWQQHL